MPRQYLILTMEPFPYFHQRVLFSLSFAHNDMAGRRAGGTVIVPPSALSMSRTDTELHVVSSEN